MERKQKILTMSLWAVLVLAMAGIVGAGLMQRMRKQNAQATELPVLFEAGEFGLNDQEGRPVSSASLKGHPYVAAFIFTHCAGVCPMMTQKMATLQKMVTTPDVKLITFTVDPERDTPEVLKEYARRFGADTSRWHFLTGTQEQMNAAAKGMNVAAMKMADGSDQFIHYEKFILIDADGRVRGLYSSGSDDELKRLAADAEALAEGAAL